MSWWKRFKPNRATLPTAFLAATLCALGMLALWLPDPQTERVVQRYGNGLAATLAHANAGRLLHRDRIELAVIANQVNRLDAISAVVFYDGGNEILALSGNTEAGRSFTASATLDDTLTGYVSVVVAHQAFAPPPRTVTWLLSLLVWLATPLLTLGLLQLSRRGNRSLPIVSVPEARPASPQPCFALALNLHNQMALDREQRRLAIEDAMTLAREVCAIHPGIAVSIADRGLLLLFDQQSVSAGAAVRAAFLTASLVHEFETAGVFRLYLDVAECPGAPAELPQLTLKELDQGADIDRFLTLAALAKAGGLLLAKTVRDAMSDAEQTWVSTFEHPLLDDIDAAGALFCIEVLPESEAETIEHQAQLILGFTPH